MDADRGCAGYRGYLSSHLVAWFEAAHCAMKHHKIGDVAGVVVTVTVHMLESSFLKLTDEIFVERSLEFRWNRDFVRLDHRHLNAVRFDFGRCFSSAPA